MVRFLLKRIYKLWQWQEEHNHFRSNFISFFLDVMKCFVFLNLNEWNLKLICFILFYLNLGLVWLKDEWQYLWFAQLYQLQVASAVGMLEILRASWFDYLKPTVFDVEYISDFCTSCLLFLWWSYHTLTDSWNLFLYNISVCIPSCHKMIMGKQ